MATFNLAVLGQQFPIGELDEEGVVKISSEGMDALDWLGVRAVNSELNLDVSRLRAALQLGELSAHILLEIVREDLALAGAEGFVS